jgi:nucleoside-diphosphate-sugar epimerase
LSVLELLELLQGTAGTYVERLLVPLRPGELVRSAIDSRAAQGWGWRPGISLDDGVAETFRWYAGQQAA